MWNHCSPSLALNMLLCSGRHRFYIKTIETIRGWLAGSLSLCFEAAAPLCPSTQKIHQNLHPSRRWCNLLQFSSEHHNQPSQQGLMQEQRTHTQGRRKVWTGQSFATKGTAPLMSRYPSPERSVAPQTCRLQIIIIGRNQAKKINPYPQTAAGLEHKPWCVHFPVSNYSQLMHRDTIGLQSRTWAVYRNVGS